jgi:hypothetical protein
VGTDATHAIRFYDQDDALVHTVAPFLASAIKAGGVAVMVATEEHRRACEASMAAAGVDVGAAWSAGSLLVYDAGEAMRQWLCRHDRPEEPGFGDVARRLLMYAARRGGPVCAFGEAVSLLWAAGHRNESLQLEAMWEDLQREVPFARLCAYQFTSIDVGEQADFRRLCDLHSRVDGTPPGGGVN